MSDCIEHIGRIIKMEKNRVFVSIYSKSACFACDAKKSCKILSGTAEKILEVNVKENNKYTIGQQIKFSMRASAGYKSVLLAYLIPFALMITGMMICNSIFHNEALIALTAVMVLIIYYFVLSKFKKRLDRNIILNIEPYQDS